MSTVEIPTIQIRPRMNNASFRASSPSTSFERDCSRERSRGGSRCWRGGRCSLRRALEVPLKVPALALTLFLSAGCSPTVHVVYEEPPADLPANSYVYLGNWIGCVTKLPETPSDHSQQSEELEARACDRIEPFRVGARVPPGLHPSQEIPQPNGAVAMVLPIRAPEGHTGYFVVTHRDSVISSVQLTADFKVSEYSFSTISPGDSMAKVDKSFGPRFSERPSPEIRGTLRDYAPFPFSIEYVNGVVYSIRVGM